MKRLRRLWLRLIAPRTPLARERFYLVRAIEKTRRAIDDIYYLPYSCCHMCAYPELPGLHDRLDRQAGRLAFLNFVLTLTPAKKRGTLRSR